MRKIFSTLGFSSTPEPVTVVTTTETVVTTSPTSSTTTTTTTVATIFSGDVSLAPMSSGGFKKAKLTEEKILRIKRIKEQYADKDGKIKEEELKRIQLEYDAKHEIARELVLIYDTDADGKLSVEDLANLDADVKTTDTNLRYAGYTAILARLIRYTAYTSDIGESFRPLAHPRIVTASYGLSWAYVIGDVGYEGYKNYKTTTHDKNALAQLMIKRTVFQSVASMALPAFMIHTQVRIFKKVFTKVGKFQRWGPTVAGLALVPLLPFVIDHPVEHALNHIFDRVWPVNNNNNHRSHDHPEARQ